MWGGNWLKSEMKPSRSAKSAKRAEQDSAWKDLLDRYFPEFIAFFFPAIYREIDWTRKPVFLDKELHKLGPAHETGKRLADKQQTRDLLRFLDWVFKLPEELEEKLSYDMQAKVEGKRMPYVTSWERIAQKRGEQSGRLAVVLRLLKLKIGELDEKLRERIENLSSARLDQLAVALLKFTEPSDLERWLKRRKA